MVIYRKISDVEHNANTILTVGTFDGVHRGHRAIINRMKELAAIDSSRVAVVTFDPHPQIVLNKSGREEIKLLTSINERLRLLADAGVDTTIIIPFTFEIAGTDAEDFIRNIIHGKIGVKHILAGVDHTFGKDRKGNDELLQNLGVELDFTVDIVAPLMFTDVKVSSTQIRKALKSANLSSANDMLGYDYSLEGIVVEGDGRGRRLGYPTANIESMEPHKLLPANGIYLVSAVIDSELKYGMASIGTRPTFTDDIHPRLEIYFFNYSGILYNRRLNVHFHNYIRPETKFDSIDLFWSALRDDQERCEELILQREIHKQ